MKKIIFFLIAVVIFSSFVSAQPQIDWLVSQQGSTGLVDSYESDGYNYAYTYDQALAVIAFTEANKIQKAKNILNKMQSLQLSNGAWYQCYDAANGNLGNSGCNYYPVGDISWIVMAINFYEVHTGDDSYFQMAIKALNWLDSMRNTNPTEEKYGSLNLCSGTACAYPNAISTENNYDAYSAYYYRGMLEDDSSLIEKSNLVKNYLVTEMWSNSPDVNCLDPHPAIFWLGYNDCEYWTDPQSWGILALGPNGPNGEDYTLALEWLYEYGYTYGSTRHTQTFNPEIDGFDFQTKAPLNSVWLEGTEGVAAAYYSIGDIEKGDYFHNQTKKLVSGNGGVIYSFSETNPTNIRWKENFRRNSLASTAWYYFNEKRINPFNLDRYINNIIINEFLPNPTGYDNALMPNGEWVELYNNGALAVNLSGFVLYDLHDTNELYITNTNTVGDLVLQPGEYLIVYRDGDGSFTLNNGGDEIRLYDGYPISESNLIDSINYSGSTEDSSWSLINGTWNQTIQTPGAENTFIAANETAIAKRVIDGDTLELENGERVRLTGIDTPEVGEYYYESAKNRLKELVEGKTIILERDVENRDMYNRLLRYIYFNDSFVNLVLVQEGYARAYPYPPNTKYEAEFAQAETEAKNNKLGIWNNASLIISLNQGWNLISIPLILEDNSVSAVFEGINYSKLFYYDDGWEGPTEIDNTLGYWIKINNTATLTVGGLPLENPLISLNPGWNLKGYPSLEEKTISELFNNATVYMYNNSKWYSYDSGKPFNTLTTFKPGFGYWLYSNLNLSLIIS